MFIREGRGTMLEKIVIIAAVILFIAVTMFFAYIKYKLCENSPCLQIRLNGSCPFNNMRSCKDCPFWEPAKEEEK